jgi:predicted esterase
VALGRRADGRSAFGWSAGTDRGPRAALAHVRGQFSVNPDRVFLVGIGAGAAAACRFALESPGQVSGVVALNGVLPSARIPANRLRLLIGHATANPTISGSEARRTAARLTASGANVQLRRYATSQAVNVEMLRDANRWIMDQIAEMTAGGE